MEDGAPLILGTGHLAKLTKASIVGAMGDTVVLTTIATELSNNATTSGGKDSHNNNSNSRSFENFTVDYRQRYHGVGKIPTTSAARRDNATPSNLETLGSRAIDRALRPLLRLDAADCGAIHVQSSAQGCASDGGNPVAISINAASVALMSHGMISEPVAAVSLGVLAGTDGRPKILINPSPLLHQQQQQQQQQQKRKNAVSNKNNNSEHMVCELLYAGTRTKAVMAEFQYHRALTVDQDGNLPTSIPETELAQLLSLAQAAIHPLLDTQEEFIANQLEQSKPSERRESQNLQEESEIRATLGLPPLPTENLKDEESNSDWSAKALELLEDAIQACEVELKEATLALFGCKIGETSTEQELQDVDYQSAYVHPKEFSSDILPKSLRGRRETIVQEEIERILTEWVASRLTILDGADLSKLDTDEKQSIVQVMVSTLKPLVHKSLLKKALHISASQFGTRADHRFGGPGPDPHNKGYKTIRPLSLTVPALPEIVHGSAIFARGDTQVLCTATLGAPRDGIPNRDPFLPPLPNPGFTDPSGTEKETNVTEDGTPFDELPVGSLRFLRTQEATISDLNSRKSKVDREMTGASGNLWDFRRAFLQYDFPSYSTGELPMGGQRHNRRAIGHGALAEKAILSVLPSPQDFPYCVRITSEVTDSNGSSSMASVCGATLALLDAGVPLVAPVAGVSVGLALPATTDISQETGDYQLLLDITGTEDHYGAMDFKIAGTYNGVTAFQLDVKTPIPLEVLPGALELAKSGRQAMLKEMETQCKGTVLQGLKARRSLKDSAPRVEVIRFDPQRKRDLIGPGGAVLRQLEDRYDVSVDLTQEGQCLLFGSNKDMVAEARSVVADIVADVEVGEIYEGTIVEIKDFGAIVELLRNKEGLLHVSELADNISDPQGNLGVVQKYLKVGDKIKVLCTGVDPVMGSIRLSVKAMHEK